MTDIVKEYSKALYELSEEENLESEFLGEIRMLSKIISDSPEFISLLSAPNISKYDRMNVIDKAFSGRFHEYICSFMKLMTRRGHARFILPCFTEYEKLWYEKSGIIVAEVKTAIEMTLPEKNVLYKKLEEYVGKSVEMRCTTDSSIIGGVSIMIGGILLEGSVKARLTALHEALFKKTL